ncbi:MAG TPA: 1-acyl-sn-glycerol-3-phosphate acyltransferase [Candidatus Woesebacteria bacterium]|nr:1-acyl-sn-glycerol-3-phosphate acyltransferase [Candidatus Woesebacteria bacterium]
MHSEHTPSFSVRELLAPFLSQKEQTFFKENNNKVTIHNFPQTGSLIVANHPTIDDSHIWRLEPKAIHAVHSDALKKTGVTPIDRMIALHYSRMIPVHSADNRQETYHDIVNLIEQGYAVIINPTGETSGNNDIPMTDKIKIGGIIRPWQLSNTDFNIFPAYVHISNITNNFRIAKGSDIHVEVTPDPLQVSDIFTKEGNVNQDIFATRLIESWQNLAEQIQ